MNAIVPNLRPRKSPVQARSAATVDAMRIAAIQVLTQEGVSHCTTSRIAERAGVSVGSFYQYYPNRDAILAAILETRLDDVARAVDRACRAHRGKSVADMAAAVVAALLATKRRNLQESRALYAVAAELGGAAPVARMRNRIVAAIADMLAHAPGADFEDPAMTGAIAFSAVAGPIRSLLEGNAPAEFDARLEEQLILLLTGYLGARRRPAGGAKRGS